MRFAFLPYCFNGSTLADNIAKEKDQAKQSWESNNIEREPLSVSILLKITLYKLKQHIRGNINIHKHMIVLTQTIVLHFKLCFPKLTIYTQSNILHSKYSIFLNLHIKSKLFKSTPQIKCYFHRKNKCYRLCPVRTITLSVRESTVNSSNAEHRIKRRQRKMSAIHYYFNRSSFIVRIILPNIKHLELRWLVLVS